MIDANLQVRSSFIISGRAKGSIRLVLTKTTLTTLLLYVIQNKSRFRGSKILDKIDCDKLLKQKSRLIDKEQL